MDPTQPDDASTDPLRQLAAALTTVAASVDAMARDQRAAERRRNWRSAGMAIAMCILLFIALTNRTVLDKINGVTGPTAIDRQAVNTASLLAGSQRETDCLSRRQQARLPAPLSAPQPPPGIRARDLAVFLAPYSCAAQTPEDVYPGVKGEPPRG